MKQSQWSVFIPVLSAVLGFVGGLGGVFLTQSMQRGHDIEKSALEARQKAYSDFFLGQSILWTGDAARTEEANQQINRSKLQILLTAPENIVHTMVDYWNTSRPYPTCPNPDEARKDAKIYQEMRADSFRVLELSQPGIAEDILVAYVRNCTLPNTKLSQP